MERQGKCVATLMKGEGACGVLGQRGMKDTTTPKFDVSWPPYSVFRHISRNYTFFPFKKISNRM